MNDVSIRVDNLSKLYHLGATHQRHDTMRDALMGMFRRSNGHTNDPAHNDSDELWALNNISFEVKRGEVVGIIGRNGAGKSTLLKILSRITEPTDGRALIHGRVGSLLEVGTGFHQELTGRENIFFNGAMLGMRRSEIESKFDEIVAFAEVDRFLDTPVKRYSSGMYVRLAFAVAAHLEPEILLVDEVLAVGDAAFQRKCLGKMGDVAHQGRTVLFVSHNMAAVQALCGRGIFLHQGRVAADDVVGTAVMSYLRTLDLTTGTDLMDRTERRGTGNIRLSRVQILTAGEDESLPLVVGSPANFIFYVTEVHAGLSCTFTIYDYHGQAVTNFNSAITGDEDDQSSRMDSRIVCRLDELLLVPGRYRINVAIAVGGALEDHVEAAAFFDVEPGLLHGRPIAVGSGYGSACMAHRWTVPA